MHSSFGGPCNRYILYVAVGLADDDDDDDDEVSGCDIHCVR